METRHYGYYDESYFPGILDIWEQQKEEQGGGEEGKYIEPKGETKESFDDLSSDDYVVTMELSESTTFSMDGDMKDGREVDVLIKNTSASDITVTINNTMNGLTCFVDGVSESKEITIGSGLVGEVNVLFNGNTYYIVTNTPS